jgi:hypothetical protein
MRGQIGENSGRCALSGRVQFQTGRQRDLPAFVN